MNNILTKKFLIQEHNNKNKTIKEIAKITSYSKVTIWRYFKKYGIKIKILSDILTKKYLIEEYSKNKKSQLQIAKEFGCSQVVVGNYLKKFKIPMRTLSEAHKGKFSGNKNPCYIDGRKSKIYYCKELGCNNKICYENHRNGSRRCRSCDRKIKWLDKKFREQKIESLMKGRLIKPNRPEKLLNKILQKFFPKEYKYVGNGEIVLEGFNPDFININGQKKIIEMYGDYWHNLASWKERDRRRLITYKKLGYKTLIVWQHELKDLDKLKEKLNAF